MNVTSTRNLLLASAALLAFAAAHPAAAQSTPPATGNDAEPATAQAADDQIIVTGTRAPGRSRLDSVAPVDVLTGDALRAQGTTELASALATVAPSIDFPRQAAVDGTDAIRPATLRGLSPDQTLVLINGTRAHTSALLNINGSVGRGAAAVDLNTIPTVALDRVEVLRDGASAQYGSDAIAGVVNLRLREARSGGGAAVTFGRYVTEYDAARISRTARDGEALTVSGWQGFGLGADGFLTVSGEYVSRQPTNRADLDPRGAAPLRIRARFGDPQVEQGTVFVNAAVPLGDNGWTAYANGGFQQRDSESAAFPRVPNATGSAANANANALQGLYPAGFLPLIGTTSRDYNATGGIRGELGGWNADLTVSYGRNTIDFATRNSANATYGNASITNFDSGRLTYDQLIAGLDLAREYSVSPDFVLNVAAGGEYRREGFKIGAGQPESYNRATGAPTNLASGAQGFVGFQPANQVDVHRSNGSIYADVEARLWDALTLGVAARGESYSDFGETATGKVSARYDFTPWLALRGSVSTGFRAPSLQQQYYTSTQTLVTANQLLETGLYPVGSGIAQALGALPLEPEKSRSYTLGTVIRAGGFSLTVDAYRIRIRNQIVLSENIQASSSAAVGALLSPFGVQAARFFVNGVQTTTKGLDVVAGYTLRSDSLGSFNLSAAANFNDISVDRIPTSTATLNPAPSLFGRNRILTIEQGTPRTKLVGSIDWKRDAFGATLRAVHYGDVLQPGTVLANDVHTGRHTLIDLEARYSFNRAVSLAIGADNLFDVYPRTTPAALNNNGVTAFPYYSPFGFNGRQIYGRLNINW